MKLNTCCFIGHRTINETEELKTQLFEIIEKLIVERKVDTFLFGSKSRFDDFCYSAVTKIKEKYPHIKRIYMRAEYPYINENYEDYSPKNRKSGTALALSYALKKNKKIIKLPLSV